MKGYSKLKKVIISCNIVAILCLIVLDVFVSRYVFSPITEYELVVNYGESHGSDKTASLYYTPFSEMFDEEHKVTATVDARDVELVFPGEKRNLIYIFLESMELTYADAEFGGGMTRDLIPELISLAQDNICFSGDGLLNGAHYVNGAEFTMGALVAQTSGVPINETLVSNDTLNSFWTSENNYLPGVYTIGDVLQSEGYNQEFLIESNGAFAGRSSYFSGHGNYDVVDYNSAVDKGWIDPEYFVWWGYEDSRLFEFAKRELDELAKKDAPFNLTMLTADTHFVDGYLCPKCDNLYPEQYSNVISCSSRQVYEFVEWIKNQDFYYNTTIVLIGDHLTMDSEYINIAGVEYFDRRMYCCIINPDEKCGLGDS